jgi:hypothetical protein
VSIDFKFRDLFTSRHTKFLEAELVRVRLEYQAEIRRLREELQKMSVLVSPLPAPEGFAEWLRRQKKTMARSEGESTTFAEELEKHNAIIEKEEAECQSLSPSQNRNGRAAAARSPTN